MKTTDQGSADRGRPEAIKAVPVRHPGRWASVAVIAVLAAMLLHVLFTNEALDWAFVGAVLRDPTVIHGIWSTLELTALAMLMGVVGGVLLAVMRLSRNPVLSGTAWLYIWIFRGTPVLVQLVFWNNIGVLWKQISLGVPFGPAFWSQESNTLVPVFTAALLGLGLNEAAYMAEIVRAGIQSVDEGQAEAAHALGMSRATALRRIVLPQAMRVIIPPTGNETISMLKTTSLVQVIALVELFTAGHDIATRTYKPIPAMIAVSIYYLLLTSILTVGQYYLERHFARGANRTLPPTPLQRARALFTGRAPAARTAAGSPPSKTDGGAPDGGTADGGGPNGGTPDGGKDA
ncbi:MULTISPECIES: amino acid ABC transporter permease [Kitasatospora]|uniref:Putative amino acid ABC transporter permease protein n=1 Tax=Kitasatospora setae (strain ATCC 33774 / DSM 43861 / JCM 3304 / KCC A-0304 / NBRC 14216 / KM-6054) TaxID=452652 RepID=E4NGV2_KITSK|nr:amino acid ABC transporter permease [Kitasatospora setae]BAJ30732.1 putative amino acid ABC transporter permease protein [Kitasatospora setae KM-6054]